MGRAFAPVSGPFHKPPSARKRGRRAPRRGRADARGAPMWVGPLRRCLAWDVWRFVSYSSAARLHFSFGFSPDSPFVRAFLNAHATRFSTPPLRPFLCAGFRLGAAAGRDWGALRGALLARVALDKMASRRARTSGFSRAGSRSGPAVASAPPSDVSSGSPSVAGAGNGAGGADSARQAAHRRRHVDLAFEDVGPDGSSSAPPRSPPTSLSAAVPGSPPGSAPPSELERLAAPLEFDVVAPAVVTDLVDACERQDALRKSRNRRSAGAGAEDGLGLGGAVEVDGGISSPHAHGSAGDAETFPSSLIDDSPSAPLPVSVEEVALLGGKALRAVRRRGVDPFALGGRVPELVRDGGDALGGAEVEELEAEAEVEERVAEMGLDDGAEPSATDGSPHAGHRHEACSHGHADKHGKALDGHARAHVCSKGEACCGKCL